MTAFLAALNLVFVIADDLRDLDELGDAGNVSTPHLDALRDQSVVFARATAAAHMCGPARQSIMTGLLCRSHGVYNNQATHADAIPGYPYLHAALQAEGYATAGIGKIFHSGNAHIPPGFDVEIAQVDDDQTLADAVGFLETAAEPFALFVGFYKPHEPFDCGTVTGLTFPAEPAESSYRWGALKEDVWSNPAMTEQERRDYAGGYYACVEALDARIGQLMQHVPDDTVVIFTSDHGYSLGEHRGYSYEKTVHCYANVAVPLYIRTPGHKARAVQEVVSHVDVYPTVFDLLNLPLPIDGDGASLLPAMTGHEGTHQYALSESRNSTRHGGWGVVTADRALYLWKKKNIGEAFTAVRTDPHGFANLETVEDYAPVADLIPWSGARYELENSAAGSFLDRDGDGASNVAELMAGTDPADPTEY